MWEAKPTFQWRAWILIMYATATWCSTRIYVDQVWQFLIRVKSKPTKSLKTPHVANPLTNVALLNPFAMTSVPTDLLSFRCSSFSSYRRTHFPKSNAKPFSPAHFVFSSKPPNQVLQAGIHGLRNFPGSAFGNPPTTCWGLPALWLWSNSSDTNFKFSYPKSSPFLNPAFFLLRFLNIRKNAGGVLDRFAADHIGIHTGNHICHLRASRIAWRGWCTTTLYS